MTAILRIPFDSLALQLQVPFPDMIHLTRGDHSGLVESRRSRDIARFTLEGLLRVLNLAYSFDLAGLDAVVGIIIGLNWGDYIFFAD